MSKTTELEADVARLTEENQRLTTENQALKEEAKLVGDDLLSVLSEKRDVVDAIDATISVVKDAGNLPVQALHYERAFEKGILERLVKVREILVTPEPVVVSEPVAAAPAPI